LPEISSSFKKWALTMQYKAAVYIVPLESGLSHKRLSNNGMVKRCRKKGGLVLIIDSLDYLLLVYPSTGLTLRPPLAPWLLWPKSLLPGPPLPPLTPLSPLPLPVWELPLRLANAELVIVTANVPAIMTAAISAIRTIDIFFVIFYEILGRHITLTRHEL
jgi:hypothetical protein